MIVSGDEKDARVTRMPFDGGESFGSRTVGLILLWAEEEVRVDGEDVGQNFVSCRVFFKSNWYLPDHQSPIRTGTGDASPPATATTITAAATTSVIIITMMVVVVVVILVTRESPWLTYTHVDHGTIVLPE